MNVLAILKDFTQQCKSIFENTTTKMSKRFLNWLILTIRTVALIPGKVNFTRLSRYGGRTAKTFSANFKTSVQWLSVNMKLAREAFGGKMDDVAIAIDPSFLSKAGKLTYGIGKFWSGVAQRVKRGLEIMAIGAISLNRHSCVMLGAVQTPSSDLRKKNDASMIEWYLSLLRKRKDELLSFSRIIVADAFFSVSDFVNEIVGMGFDFVGRLKDNAYLRYLAVQDTTATKKRGRKKMYGDKVDFSNPDMSVFTPFIYVDHKGVSTECYCAVVRSRALKRNIKIVVFPVKGCNPIVYFSTDLEMEAKRIVGFYRTRFQIEFGIRDAKQFTGLQSSQTRDKDRLDFAFNLSFTTLNICKAVIRQVYPDLTVAQFKRLMFESYLASTIISTYGKSPHLKIIQKINHKLTEIAA